MTEKLITVKEPRTQVSGLTYSNIIEDVYSLIKDNPHLNESITDYTSADSVRMLTELFAWVTDQLSQRMDLVANELYLDTVENKENLIKMLKIIGFELDFPECARAEFDIKITNYDKDSGEEMVLSPGAQEGNTINLRNTSFKRISDGVSDRSFELILFDSSENKYEYFTPVSVDIKEINKNKLLYEGRTSSLAFRVDTRGYFTKAINESVIKNSIRIFYTNFVNGEPIEIKQVENFFGPETVYHDGPVYRVSNLGGGRAEIIFPNSEDVAERNLLEIGDEMTVLYRVGGGRAGNINVGDINFSEEIWLNNGKRRGYISYKNTFRGVGGINEETMEDIRRKAPQKIKNRLSAVTSSDYEEILLNHDPTIKDIRVYGENNIPEGSNIIGTYGFSRNPLDVWLFIIKENTRYHHDIIDVTDYINDISFQALDLNERMNEIYQVNKSSMNFLVERGEYGDEIISSADSNTPFYYELDLPIEFTNEMGEAVSEGIASLEITDFSVATTTQPFSDKDNIDSDRVKYLLENAYYGDLVKTPTKTSPFTSEGYLETIYEDVDVLLSNIIDRNSIFEGIIEFEGEEISFEDSLIEDLIEELNMRMNLRLNSKYPSVILKDNIELEDRDSNSEITGNVEIEIEFNGDTYEYSFQANNEPWSELPDLILSASGTSGTIGQHFKCALVDKTYEESDCLVLVLYTEEESIKKFKTTSDKFGLDGVMSSAIVKKDASEITELEDYVIYSFGSVYLLGDALDGILEFGNTPLLVSIFNLSSDDFYDNKLRIGRRKYIEIAGGKIRIGVTSSASKLPKEIYVTGIWGKSRKIKLGSFYENIDKNNKFSASLEIKNLLKRGPIKDLYNTATREPMIGEINTDPIDTYNSDYEVKITRRKALDKTYFQIGIDEEHAEVTMIPQRIDTEMGTQLFLKVDGKNYSINGAEREDGDDVSLDIVVEEGGDSYTISEYAFVDRGFVRFDTSPFSQTSTDVFLEAIVKVFELSEGKVSIYSKGGSITLRTDSNFYYSSLDFGETSKDLLKYYFGLLEGKNIIYSNSSFVPLKKADYLKFSLIEKSFSPRKNVKFVVRGNTYTVSTGNSLTAFLSNLQNTSGLSDKIVVRGLDIFLVSKEKDETFTLRIDSSEKNMFYETADIVVELPEEPEEPDNEIEITKRIDGDYYISKTKEGFILVPLNFEKFPLGDLYFHMLEDYRHDHIHGDLESRDYTDEYKWNSLIDSKKMLCVSHVFRQPKFIPFSAIISARISKNVAFRKEKSYSDMIYNHLVNKYSIYSPNLGETTYQSDIRDAVLEIPGVMEVSIEYLGFSPNDLSTTQSSLGAKFNEKLIIASKKEKEVVREGLVSREPEQGLFVKVEYR